MKTEKKISGSILAKVVAFFVLAISVIVGLLAVGGIVLLLNSNAYNYQSQDKCVQETAREMMVNYAWSELHRLRDYYSADDMEHWEEYSENRNFTAEIYKEDELLWGNYEGEETPYSFRYTYSQWVDEPVSGEEAESILPGEEIDLPQETEVPEEGVNPAVKYAIVSEQEFLMDKESVEQEELEKTKAVWREFTIRLYVDPAFAVDDEYCAVYNRAVILCEGRDIYPIVAVACVLLSIICFIFLMCSAGHRNGKVGITPGMLTAIHFDVLTIVFGTVAFTGFVFLTELIAYGFSGDVLWQLGLAALLGGAEVVWCTIYCMDFAVRLKLGAWWKHTLIAATLRWIGRIVKFVQNSLAVLIKGFPLVINVAIVFLGFCILEFGVLYGILGRYQMFRLFILWFLEKALLFGVVMYIALVCKKLQEGSEALAEGDLNFKMDTTNMLFAFREHGENLNQIGEGISKAVAERMKSEHLKTELITNVSHDLKTPLTSIINYADLLAHEVGNAETEDDKIAEYAEVLHRQSKRLKKLLEDLVEASKATTGALEVNLAQCEISVLLSQAVGEYEQRFEEKQLNLIVRQPEEPVRIMADGRHLWRVFDNLLNNICKYAQENTRVYLSVENKEGQVEIIFRNMSKYALDVSAEELEERFVRGDKSRHMEGNGLGLSIAKSLVELQNGRMEIVTDGDLFKVVLCFKAI